jgi:hypothetical protein
MALPMFLPKIVTGDAPDRRRRPRFRLAYPVRLWKPGDAVRVETKTENLSCEGFFCASERIFSPRQTLECEIVIFSDKLGQPLEQDIVLRCRAEVVRVVPWAFGAALGVACRFADYAIDQQFVAPGLEEEYSI